MNGGGWLITACKLSIRTDDSVRARLLQRPVDLPNHRHDFRRYQVFPGVAAVEPLTNLGSRYKANVFCDFQEMYTVPDCGRRLVSPLSGGDQQLEPVHHPFKCARLAIVPTNDALGGIAATDEQQPDLVAV